MKSIDGLKFAEMVKLGSHHLYQNADYVDSLNVFPVPDGDTGTNMNLSMSSGAKEIEAHAVVTYWENCTSIIQRITYGGTGKFWCYSITIVPWIW